MKPFCPHCGYDLRMDQPVLIDDYSMLGSLSPLCWKNEPVGLTATENLLCWSLLKAYPDPVRIEVLADRCGSEATSNVTEVIICRIRKKLREMGAPNPIVSARMRGSSRAFVWKPGGHNVVVSTAKKA